MNAQPTYARDGSNERVQQWWHSGLKPPRPGPWNWYVSWHTKEPRWGLFRCQMRKARMFFDMRVLSDRVMRMRSEGTFNQDGHSLSLRRIVHERANMWLETVQCRDCHYVTTRRVHYFGEPPRFYELVMSDTLPGVVDGHWFMGVAPYPEAVLEVFRAEREVLN